MRYLGHLAAPGGGVPGGTTTAFVLSRRELLLLSVVVVMPIPLCALSGLAVPLPEIVQRVAASLVPGGGEWLGGEPARTRGAVRLASAPETPKRAEGRVSRSQATRFPAAGETRVVSRRASVSSRPVSNAHAGAGSAAGAGVRTARPASPTTPVASPKINDGDGAVKAGDAASGDGKEKAGGAGSAAVDTVPSPLPSLSGSHAAEVSVGVEKDVSAVARVDDGGVTVGAQLGNAGVSNSVQASDSGVSADAGVSLGSGPADTGANARVDTSSSGTTVTAGVAPSGGTLVDVGVTLPAMFAATGSPSGASSPSGAEPTGGSSTLPSGGLQINVRLPGLG